MLLDTNQIIVSVVVAHVIICSNKEPCWVECPTLCGFDLILCPLQEIGIGCCSIVYSART